MSRRTILPGKHTLRELVFVFGVGLVFLHGVSSSLLLEQSNCFQLFRIIDLLLLIMLFLVTALWPLNTALRRIRDALAQSTLLKLFGLLLVTYSAWILLSGLIQQASLRETFLALLFDTALFWSFFILAISQAFDKAASKRIITSSLIVVGLLAAIASVLYIVGIHDNIDAWLGYGQCTGETVLRTGGESGWLRSRGFVRNPNELGALLVLPLTLLVGMLITAKKRAGLSIYLVSLVSIEALLIFTFSRSAWLATGIALLTLALLDKRVRGLIAQPKVIGLLCVALIATVTLFATNTKLLDQLVLHRSGQSDSTSKHWIDKSNGIIYIADTPLGSGPGSSGAVGAALKDGPSINTESTYLDIGAQYGIPGILLVLTMIGVLVKMLFESRSSTNTAVLAGFVGLTVSGLLIPVWSNLTVTLLSGILLGFAYLAHKK